MNNISQEKTEYSVKNFTENQSAFSREFLFSEETLSTISRLSDVLQRIDRRMKNEGFCIKNGKIVKR